MNIFIFSCKITKSIALIFEARLADHQDILFKKFYEKFQPSLYSYALYIVRNDQDAIELVNDVFLKIWKKKNKLNLDENLKSYLFRATKNTCLNHLKKQKKTIMYIADEDDFPERSFAQEKLENKENEALLEKLIQALPPKCRQVFSMSRIDQLENKEIAELLEISIKTVENHMTKALHFFRKNLKIE